MLFRDIIGQDSLRKNLVRTVKENRVSHAWLFFGPEGAGSLPVALAFARYILCTNRSGEEACGACASCKKLDKYIHPDLHFTFPVNKTKRVDKDMVVSDDFIADWRAFILQQPYGRLTQWFDFIDLENKQGIINTEESRRLAGKLNLKPFESDYKISIIWQPEKMNDQAANKLLKLLEEPPPMTIFMLVGDPEQLLVTIRSRCVPVKVPRISSTQLEDALVTRNGIEPARAASIARLAFGSYLKALELINEASDSDYNFIKFRELMRLCFTKNIPELLKISDELATLTRERQKVFLEYGLRTIRESVALHFDEPEIVYITEEEKGFTTNFSPFITGKNVIRITEEISQAIMDIERNANGRIVFLDLALELASLINRNPKN